MRLFCPRLPDFDAEDWADAQRAFAASPPVELRQSWRATAQSALRPAWVRCGWRDRMLWIAADLQDDEIWNDATHFNQPLFLLGDVFEIFLRPSPAAYFEFHVAPHNLTMQLRWPDARTIEQLRAATEQKGETVAEVAAALEPFLLPTSALFTRTRVEDRSWHVLAGLATDKMEAPQSEPGDVWRFSFSRYDATRGQTPILSSSSPHEILDFHRQHEWGELIFK